MRLADDGFKIFSSVFGDEIDPKRFDEASSLIEPPLRTAEDGAKYYLLPVITMVSASQSKPSECRAT
jgi:hypothetical protein